MTLENKEILTLEEVALYTGYSKSHIYKLTHKNKIPFYKPSGKTLFFKFDEVKNYLLGNRISSQKEIESQASAYMLNYKKSSK